MSRIVRTVSPAASRSRDLPRRALAHAEDQEIGLGVEQIERRTWSDQ